MSEGEKNAIRKACDRCTKFKQKCDGAQPCFRCIKQGKGDNCIYLFKRKAGRKISEKMSTTIENNGFCNFISFDLNYSVPDHAYEFLDPHILQISVTFLESPILNKQELCQGIEIIQNTTNRSLEFDPTDVLQVEHQSACKITLWAALTIGAFLQGNLNAAKKYAERAETESTVLMQGISRIPSVFRCNLLMVLLDKCLGRTTQAFQRFGSVEDISLDIPELRGPIKTFAILALPHIHPFHSCNENISFVDDELSSLSFDSRVFFGWYWHFFQNAFQKTAWKDAGQCYSHLLLAEENTRLQNYQSPRNWFRLQTFLLYLEIGHLFSLQKGVQRARDLAAFIFSNIDFVKVMTRFSTENLIATVEILSQIFHITKDELFYCKMQQCWKIVVSGMEQMFLFPTLAEKWTGFVPFPPMPHIRIRIEQELSKFQKAASTPTTLIGSKHPQTDISPMHCSFEHAFPCNG